MIWERWEGVWLERGEAPSNPLQLTASHSAAETVYAQVHRQSSYVGRAIQVPSSLRSVPRSGSSLMHEIDTKSSP